MCNQSFSVVQENVFIFIFFNKKLKAMLTFLCEHPYKLVNNNAHENKLFQFTLITNLINIHFPTVS